MSRIKSVDQIGSQEMEAMGEMMKSILPQGIGFSLVIFDMGRPGTQVKYISNAVRSDMRGTLKALVSKWEAEHIQSN